jgi:hypothetical protein
VARVTLPAGGAVEYDYGPGVINGDLCGFRAKKIIIP